MNTKKQSFGFIVGDLGNGGQETQLKYLTTQLQKENHFCAVLVWRLGNDKEEFVEEILAGGCKLLCLGNEPAFKKIKLARKFFKRHQSISVHSFTHYLNFVCWAICLFTPMTPIGGIRGRLDRVSKSYGFIRFWINSFFPKFKIANNQLYRLGMNSKLTPIAFRNTKVVVNHLDVNNFKYYPPKKTEIVKTASIARLYPEKAIDVLIRAIGILVKKGVQIQHIHAGDGTLQKELEELIQQEGLQRHFIFHGETKDVSEFLKDKYLFVLSSNSEGYPNVVMEAMACGKAIVSTNCGDVPFLVENGKNGLIVPINNELAMAYAIEELILNEKEVLEYSGYSRNKAVAQFDLTHLVTETLATYSQFGIRRN